MPFEFVPGYGVAAQPRWYAPAKGGLQWSHVASLHGGLAADWLNRGLERACGMSNGAGMPAGAPRLQAPQCVSHPQLRPNCVPVAGRKKRRVAVDKRLSAITASPRRWPRVARFGDWWPGGKAEVRVLSSAMEVEPQAEPDDVEAPQSALKCAATSGIRAVGPKVPVPTAPNVFKVCRLACPSSPRACGACPRPNWSVFPRGPSMISEAPWRLVCFWAGFFACFELLERPLAPRRRFVNSKWAPVSDGGTRDKGVSASAEPAVLAAHHRLSPRDLGMLVQDPVLV